MHPVHGLPATLLDLAPVLLYMLLWEQLLLRSSPLPPPLRLLSPPLLPPPLLPPPLRGMLLQQLLLLQQHALLRMQLLLQPVLVGLEQNRDRKLEI